MALEGSSLDNWPHEGLAEWAEQADQYRGGSGMGRYEIVRATPWSTVLRWTTSTQVLWGKAACPGFASECGLLPLLAQRSPNRVLAPIAVDADRGFILMPDGGHTMKGAANVATWTRALLGYAELQQSMIDSEQQILAVGCPDMRPHAAVRRLEQMMEQGHIPRHEWLLDAAGNVARQLDLDLIPATIQHDDLRPNNVFADGRVFDWGDASLAHPFASLLTALMPHRADRPGTPEQKREMSDTYLKSWQSEARSGREPIPLALLREQAALAVALAPIGRIDTWLRAPAAALVRYPDAVDRWVDHLLATDWSQRPT